VLTLCDTVGDCTAGGVARLLEFARECVQRHGGPVRIWWHGHNDRGLAFANAVAAVEAGAHAVSGAFLGLGERAGNTALEQIVMFAHQHGNTHFQVQRLLEYCGRLAHYTATEVPGNAPLVGEQAFATCTGTHSAAILKARRLGLDFEDLVFSSIPASELGRAQNILIGPTSGLANARHVLETLRLDASDEKARQLVRLAKKKDRYLRVEEIRHLMEGAA
jgi:2-isopropylmalate synthase